MTYEDAVNAWRDKGYRPKDYPKILKSFSILLAFNSGKIENPEIKFLDVHNAGAYGAVSAFSARNCQTLREISNAFKAFDFMCDALKDGHMLDEDLILQIHARLTKNAYDPVRLKKGERPGEYKHGDYAVAVDDETEIGASAEDAPEELRELLDEMSDLLGEKDSLSINNSAIAAAYFHAKFESIHPFADGNGRTGRLAMNYLLLSLNCPPVFIASGKSANEYYEALKSYHDADSVIPLADLIKDQTVYICGLMMKK